MIAEVIATYGRHLLLRDPAGTQYKARPIGRKLGIVCGDRVECELHKGEVLVRSTLPRSTFLRRTNLRGRSEPFAANLTQIAVVLAPRPAPDLFMLDRYLATAECAGLSGLIVAGKNDLPGSDELLASLAAHARLGYRIVSITTRAGGADPSQGIGPLREAFRDQTTILVGQSGVGKSSLTRLLCPDAADIAIGGLVRDEEGRHTTTASHLYDCAGGGRLMDSPGVRDFAPAIDDLEPATLGFLEVARLAPGCRFLDCRHLAEPGCAVREAAAGGAMDARRYESYRRLRRLYDELWEQRPPHERAARARLTHRPG